MISNELLKKKILDEAIHGRLVENDSSLEPIDVQSINNDIPFEVPNNWKWINFKSGFELKQGIQINIEFQSPVKNDIYPLQFLRIVDFTQNNKDIRYVSDKYINYFLEKNDVAMVRYGNPGFVCSGKKGVLANNLFKIIPKFKLKHKYLVYLLESDFIQSKILSHSVALSAIKFSDIYKLNIPIPPLEEQEKIVKKIEELFELIDKKEKNDKEKEKLKTLLKEKILDSAIHGELVENDLSLPAIDVEETKENMPFNIPNNWIWKRMSDCYVFKQGVQIDIDKQSFIKNETTPLQFLRIVDFTQNNNDIRYVSNEYDSYILNKNEIAIVRYGASAGFVCLGKKGVLANNLFKLIPQITIDVNYMFNFLNSSYFQSKVRTHSVAMPSLKFASLNKIMIAIPPLEQQKKIVEKIEECFKLIEQL